MNTVSSADSKDFLGYATSRNYFTEDGCKYIQWHEAVSSTWKTHDSTHTEIRRQKYRVFNKVLTNISDKLKRSKVWYILIKTKNGRS